MSITVFSEGPLQHILLIPAAWSILCSCFAGVCKTDKANHSLRLSAHLLPEPLSYVSNPVVKEIARKEVTPNVVEVAKQDEDTQY